ncbi:MAG: hypothetical protein ACRDWY_15945 [Actinomycetes bacterium]
MNAAETVLLLAVVALPIGLGALAGATRRPWWWAAAAGVAVMLVAAIAPEPEAGEPRLVAGDLVFLLVVAGCVAGLVWLSAWTTRRLRSRLTQH